MIVILAAIAVIVTLWALTATVKVLRSLIAVWKEYLKHRNHN